jgi:hypothetical protein
VKALGTRSLSRWILACLFSREILHGTSRLAEALKEHKEGKTTPF